MSPTLDPRRGRHLWNFIIWLQPAENSPLGGKSYLISKDNFSLLGRCESKQAVSVNFAT